MSETLYKGETVDADSPLESGEAAGSAATTDTLSAGPTMAAGSDVYSATTAYTATPDIIDGEVACSVASANTITAAPGIGEVSCIPPAPSPRIALPGRYEDLGQLGEGGFGEVRRVRDTLLDRRLVMKLLHAELCVRRSVRRRFFTEVQTTAQLQHPGIVPVHDYGELPDGRLWFTMKEVRGRTFGAVVHELHKASTPERFGTTASGWTFRRALDAFARMAQAVAYAHANGVLHRDLKPENLMVGELGEALVMDWGLARRIHSEDTDEIEHLPSSSGTRSSPNLTQHGDILGTPAFMPPEQASGASELHGPHSDVYALGAILYHLLCGHPPYRGGGMRAIAAIMKGPPEPVLVAAQGGPPVPHELARLCDRAMSRQIEDRGTAEAFAEALIAWLDGAQRREQALRMVEQAGKLLPEIDRLRRDAEDAAAKARALLEPVHSFDPIEAKRPAWQLDDHSAELRRTAALSEAKWLQVVHGALAIDPDLPEAHAMLADHYRNALMEAERAHRSEDTARAEEMLRAHDRGRHAAFLRGDGAVTLLTDPPGAEVALYRYEMEDRRLVPIFERHLGETPLRKVPVQRGSYLLILRAPGHAKVRYPILVDRAGHWDGVPPGESESFPIVLPKVEELGPNDCYVPAGLCWVGGDPDAPDSLPGRRIWVDAFVIGRFPVTNQQYVDFLNALVKVGRVEEALGSCPREQVGLAESTDRQPLFERDGSGRFVLPHEPLWDPHIPIVQIDWHAASAYSLWLAETTGRPWRLVGELEREKAARGVDGRVFPWGDQPEATYACVAAAQREEPSREPVSGHPEDESIYTVRGLAGNVRDWCLEVWRHDGPERVKERLVLSPASADDPEFRAVRGGYWGSSLPGSRSAARFGSRPHGYRWSVGCRLARSIL